MQHYHDILTVTVQSSGTFEALSLIGYDGAAVTTADAPVLGVARSPNTVVGDYAAVMTIGWARVRAAGIVTVGAKLVSAAGGGVQVAGATPANAFATALTSAAAGEFVDILIR
ncbi:capsid cement protein [Paracoccus lutimaris]|uniref:Uncharacterized protein n=1 Tax=Paracoccus lutimaris TaxID=1490030 RepID=A0A368YED5_9RHOB|nr:capsid cement protein [Paracoccus lutimaris]RCW77808.1 hypothetical protein DFP89_1562 [Paracoccus lutimaris]